MADKRDKGKGKMIEKRTMLRPEKSSRSFPEVTVISSSDSDEYEGFVDEIRSTPPTKPSTSKKKAKQEFKLPPGAKLLTDSEAADNLQRIELRMESLKVQNITIPKSYDLSLEYSKDTVHYTDVKSVKRALESLKKYGVTDWETCMIANACPGNCEEAYALIPSLKDKEDKIRHPLSVVLATLANFKI